jgi:hypothetical protein
VLTYILQNMSSRTSSGAVLLPSKRRGTAADLAFSRCGCTTKLTAAKCSVAPGFVHADDVEETVNELGFGLWQCVENFDKNVEGKLTGHG